MILIPNYHLGNAVSKKSLKDLVSVSDIVTIHVPDTEQTRMMINKNVIRQFKKGAILLNYARGEVVDLEALAKALEEGHLSGAGVDVYPLEPEKNGDKFTHAAAASFQCITNATYWRLYGRSTGKYWRRCK